jgi:hypothetical protein
MEVLETHDDGRIVIEITPDENKFLVELAINTILKESIERMDYEHRTSGEGREVCSKETLKSKDK